MMGDRVVVYGGKTSPTTLSDDVFTLDVDSREWRRLLVAGAAPLGRAFHTAVAYDSAMIVFGGLVAVGMDDIHYNMFNSVANADALPSGVKDLSGVGRLKPPQHLNPTTQRKQESGSLFCLNLQRQAMWMHLTATGSLPPTRCYHSAALYDGKMLIAGGYSVHTTGQPRDSELQAVYSTYSLDLRTMVWREIASSSSLPKRWGFCSVLSGPYWIHYGGIDIVSCTECPTVSIFNVPKAEWKHLSPVEGREPSVRPRSMHTSVRWGDRIVIFGGAFDLGAEPTNQLCHFDLLSGALSVVQQSGPIPSARYGHSTVIVGSDMVIFGGTDASSTLLGDVWSLSLVTGEWRKWETLWSDASADNVFGAKLGLLAPPASAQRAAVATQSESTPADVLDAIRSQDRIDYLRHSRDVALKEKISESAGRFAAVDDNTPTAPSAIQSQVLSDVAMHTRRFRDLTECVDSAHSIAWSHWESELNALHAQNERWRFETGSDSVSVAGSFFSRYDQMLSPPAKKAILGCQTPTALAPKQHLYSSPSLVKLGLREAGHSK